LNNRLADNPEPIKLRREIPMAKSFALKKWRKKRDSNPR
jgi:hypothetical protein